MMGGALEGRGDSMWMFKRADSGEVSLRNAVKNHLDMFCPGEDSIGVRNYLSPQGLMDRRRGDTHRCTHRGCDQIGQVAQSVGRARARTACRAGHGVIDQTRLSVEATSLEFSHQHHQHL